MTPYSKACQVNLNNWLLLSHVYGYINRDDTLIPFLIIADLPRPLKATQIPPLKRNGYTISDNTDHPRLYGRGVSAPTILVVLVVGTTWTGSTLEGLRESLNREGECGGNPVASDQNEENLDAESSRQIQKDVYFSRQTEELT